MNTYEEFLNSPSTPKKATWRTVGNYEELAGTWGCATLEPRPYYCDRGHWIAKVFSNGNALGHMDARDGWPRYFMNKERAKAEIEEWVAHRLMGKILDLTAKILVQTLTSSPDIITPPTHPSAPDPSSAASPQPAGPNASYSSPAQGSAPAASGSPAAGSWDRGSWD